jgi:hypothetical protein
LVLSGIKGGDGGISHYLSVFELVRYPPQKEDKKMVRKVSTCGMLAVLAFAFMFGVTIAQTASAAGEKAKMLIGFGKMPGRAEEAMVRRLGGSVKYTYGIVPAIAAAVPEAAVSALQANPNVTYVEEDGIVEAIGQTLPWGVDHIDAEVVHPYNRGTGVKVSILDTGIDYAHPDLDDNYKHGHDYVNGDTDPMDDHFHGTYCAGILAAENNSIGVVGVAPEAWLYAVKVLNQYGSGYTSDVVAGIEWSIDNGMDIISMSFGGGPSQTEEQACNSAYEAGIVLVAAAGNRKGGAVIYPAACNSVIAVSATNQDDGLAEFSSVGPEVELAAPGVNVTSTTLGGGYKTTGGTSAACPHVAGTAALVKAAHPSWTSVQIRKRLQKTADDLGDPGRDNWYGYGLVDADEAAPPTGPNQPPVADAIASHQLRVDGSTVLLMHLNEGTDILAEDSAGLNDGEIRGATWIPDGRFDNALSFDGVDDYVQVPHSESLAITGSLTLEAWIYPRDIFSMAYGPLPNHQGEVIVRKDGSYVLYFYCEYGESGSEGTCGLDFFLYAGGGMRLGCPITRFQENRWQHVVATYDGSQARIYLNGELCSSQVFIGGIAPSSADLAIGSTSVDDSRRMFFNGAIDEVRILNRALTAEEIRADYGGDIVELYDEDGNGELMTLDASASYDPDGSIVSYEWKEGGILLGEAEIISPHVGVGTHEVTLTVTDSDGATSTDAVTITVSSSEAPPGPKMYIKNIDVQLSKKGSNWQAIAYVTIWDDSDKPVRGATVTGDWTFNDGFLNTASKSTNGEGKARLESNKVGAGAGDVFTITVTDVVKSGYTYDPSKSVEFATATVPSSKAVIVVANDLEDNYPNPFNPETNIRYSLAESGLLTLKIYNVRGQLARTLVNEVKASGTYTVRWDGKDDRGIEVANGIYLYRIVAGEYSPTKRMILLK